ncbi:type II toxin-antitoxin system RelE/ParE family toxin [Pelagibacterium halotolerans]|uniref:type II toxin-antitoxin system RelE/ParE family toxin n=1 Tax=Pelagibacterium halotolerans TaxID=531813 RepID=UPI00384AB679
MKVRWSRKALDELRGQVAYIARDNEAAALRVADAINLAGERLGKLSTGRPGRQAGTYEKLVPRLPYILVYGIDENTVTILRVIHTARDWP